MLPRQVTKLPRWYTARGKLFVLPRRVSMLRHISWVAKLQRRNTISLGQDSKSPRCSSKSPRQDVKNIRIPLLYVLNALPQLPTYKDIVWKFIAFRLIWHPIWPDNTSINTSDIQYGRHRRHLYYTLQWFPDENFKNTLTDQLQIWHAYSFSPCRYVRYVQHTTAVILDFLWYNNLENPNLILYRLI